MPPQPPPRPTFLAPLTMVQGETVSTVVDGTRARLKGMIAPVTQANGVLQVSWDNITWYSTVNIFGASTVGTWYSTDPALWYSDCYFRHFRADGFNVDSQLVLVLEAY